MAIWSLSIWWIKQQEARKKVRWFDIWFADKNNRFLYVFCHFSIHPDAPDKISLNSKVFLMEALRKAVSKLIKRNYPMYDFKKRMQCYFKNKKPKNSDGSYAEDC